MKQFFILILTTVSVLFPLFGRVYAAQIPPQIFTYQGRLTDNGGNLLGGSGTTYYFKFSIWNNPTVGNGSRVWPTTAPTSIGTTVKQGVFTVNIGDTANGYPDTLNLDFSSSSSFYLQVEASSNNSTFETLSPRQQITSAAFAQVAGAIVGTTTPSVFGTTTPATNSFVTIAATSSDSIPLSIVAALNQAVNLFQIQNSANTNLFSVSATGGVIAVAATTTSFFSTTASSTNLFTSNLSVGSLSGFLKATVGAVTTALVNLASDVTGILPIGNGGTSTSTAPAYGQLLVGNVSGAYTFMATSTLGLNAVLSFTYPLINTANTISTALGTTTSNTWAGTQTFTNTPTLSSLASTGLAVNALGVVYGVATTTFTGNNGLTLSAGNGYLVGGSNATIGLAAIAANSVLGNNTGASGVPSTLATSSLGIALSDTTGTLAVARGGTGQTSFGQGWLNSNGTTITSSTSPTVNYITATSTTATSTFANGINTTGGCLAQNGTCLTSSLIGGSGTLTPNTIPKATGAGTIGNSSVTDNGTIVTVGTAGYIANRLGIGNDSPPTGDPYSILNVKATLDPGGIGTYPGLDFYVKTTGFTINIVPIGIRATAEYIGNTTLALSGLTGVQATVKYSATATPFIKTDQYGLQASAIQNSTETMLSNYGVWSKVSSNATTGTGGMGDVFGMYVARGVFSGGKPTNYTLYGMQNYVNQLTTLTGKVTGLDITDLRSTASAGQYGIHILRQTLGTTVASIFLDGDGLGSDVVFGTAQSAKIYYDGTNLIINPKVAGSGVVSLLGGLKLVAGTTTILPLQMQSGTLLTTALAGGIEFLTDDYYATITTGAARKGIVLNDGTNLTSTRVPFATTNGRLTDSANFVFNGTNLGIGTTTPTARLTISATSTSATVPLFEVLADNGSGTTTQMVILANGNVGVGTTSPWRTLSVNGTVALNGLGTDTTVGLAGSICLDANNELKKLSGSATCITSSQAYKHDIIDLLHGLDWVRALRPVTFAYNANNTESLGFIAEEVDQVSPLLTVRNDKGKVYSVHYELIPAVLTKAVQELDARVSALEANVGVAKDMTSGWSIDASGRLVVNEIQTNKLCVGTVCVTQEQFLKMVQSSGAAASEVILPPIVVDTTSTTTTLPVDTTPPDVSTASTTSTDVIPPVVADATSTTAVE